jgi:thiamine-monophosphate kinase
MAIGEFDLIAKYFTRAASRPAAGRDGGVALGIGDDCALLALHPGMQLATSCDMLVEGRHFLSTVKPARLGHKALAVNLSDLAACGARPLAFTLALSMPHVDEVFLAGFASGLFALADTHGCELIGGDTTQGPLNICITVMGEVPTGAALLRSGAHPGDLLYVSGAVGDARLALEVFRGNHALPGSHFEQVRIAMEQPNPRVALGQALRGIASSAIDVSDGLLGDLSHVLARSGVGARVQVDAVPRSDVLAVQPLELQRLCTLSGGDDYELVFTAHSAHDDAVRRAADEAGVKVTCIGRIECEPGVRMVTADGHLLVDEFASFDHFAPSA